MGGGGGEGGVWRVRWRTTSVLPRRPTRTQGSRKLQAFLLSRWFRRGGKSPDPDDRLDHPWPVLSERTKPGKTTTIPRPTTAGAATTWVAAAPTLGVGLRWRRLRRRRWRRRLSKKRRRQGLLAEAFMERGVHARTSVRRPSDARREDCAPACPLARSQRRRGISLRREEPRRRRGKVTRCAAVRFVAFVAPHAVLAGTRRAAPEHHERLGTSHRPAILYMVYVATSPRRAPVLRYAQFPLAPAIISPGPSIFSAKRGGRCREALNSPGTPCPSSVHDRALCPHRRALGPVSTRSRCAPAYFSSASPGRPGRT